MDSGYFIRLSRSVFLLKGISAIIQVDDSRSFELSFSKTNSVYFWLPPPPSNTNCSILQLDIEP